MKCLQMNHECDTGGQPKIAIMIVETGNIDMSRYNSLTGE